MDDENGELVREVGDAHYDLGRTCDGRAPWGRRRQCGRCCAQTFRFSGRARRSEFWWWVLAYGGACGLATLADWRLDPEACKSSDSPMVVSAVVFYLLLLPHLAVTVRRLHDRAFSAWWLLLHLIPFGVVIVFALCAVDSWAAPNRYGPNPKGRSGAALPPGGRPFQPVHSRRAAGDGAEGGGGDTRAHIP